MKYIECFVVLSIVSHLYVLCIKNNHKEAIYLFNTVVLFYILTTNIELSFPSAFAIGTSLFCIFNSNYTHCFPLVSLLSLGICVYYLLQNPNVL